MSEPEINRRLSAVALLVAILAVSASATFSSSSPSDGVWRWECSTEPIRNLTRLPRCKKVHRNQASTKATELGTCKLTCGEASMLFPKPSGATKLSKRVVPFLPGSITMSLKLSKNSRPTTTVRRLVSYAYYSLKHTLQYALSRQEVDAWSWQGFRNRHRHQEASKRKMKILIVIATNEATLTLDTDESYKLTVKTNSKSIEVSIYANNFFGARHGLETLSQLTAYHKGYNSIQIIDDVSIDDKPAYPYRGVLLDTSRNYYSVDSIKRVIKAMSYNKLNTFHWHLTDTHSFPLYIEGIPELTEYGAYSRTKVYRPYDVKAVVEYGRRHGVRVVPELDQPSHTGEGWQYGEKKGLGKLAVCVNKEPWQKFCLEPPCGQLNPVNQNLYHELFKVYKEMLESFQPDLFHLGGDEINFNCWNTTQEIADHLQNNLGGREEEQMMQLWGEFLEKSTKKLYQANGGKQVPIILWTSKMTSIKYLNRFLDPKKHIIQVWSSTLQKSIGDLVENGFKTIFSNWNTLYLDCGMGSWVGEGNNWCSPYKDWKLLYDNDPIKILEKLNVNITDTIRKNILGQETALWSEQADESVVEAKIFPRASALAERLWTNPAHNWRDAEYRLVYHRQRMVNRGIRANTLQPLWCKQNAGHCYVDSTVV